MSPDPSLSAGNEPRDELHLLASRLVDGQLTGAERDRLLTLLAGRPDLHQDYLHHLTVHAYLDWMHRPPESPELEGSPTMSPAVRPRARRFVSWLKCLGRDYAREPVALAVLVVVMISGGILFWNLSQLNRPQPVAQQSAPPEVTFPTTEIQPQIPNSKSQISNRIVARLTRSAAATWAQTAIPKDGAHLKAGQKLSLKSGLAEIAFESGAKVILEGPAEFEVGTWSAERGTEKPYVPTSDFQLPRSDNSCSLAFGKLYAHVPTQARGFAVQTPTMMVVDLGTEFGVEVGTRKLERETRNSEPPRSNFHVPRFTLTEVHVLHGKVSVAPTSFVIAPTTKSQIPNPKSEIPNRQSTIHNPQSTILHAGQAIISEPDGAAPRPIKAAPARFVRELPGVEVAVTNPKRQREAQPATEPGASAHPLTEPGASAHPLMPGDIVAVTRYTRKLVKIDPRSGRQTLLFRGDRATHGSDWMCAAVDAQGRVLIGVDFGRGMVGGGVLRFDPRQNKMEILAQGGILDTGRISGLAVAADGTIHATLDTDKDYVVSIDPQSGAARAVAPFGNNIWGISTDAEGRGLLAVSDGPPGAVARIQDGAIKQKISDPSLGGARGVAVTLDGRTFVSVPHAASRSIVEIDWRRRKVLPLASVPAGASDDVALLAAEADGNLILGVFSSPGQIYRVDVAGRKCSVLASGGELDHAGGVAVVGGVIED